MSDHGKDMVVNGSSGGGGRDEVTTPSTVATQATVGTLHRGWRTSLRDNVKFVLLVAIFLGTLANGHYSAKAATQRTNSQTVESIAKEQAQLSRQQDELVDLANQIKDVTTPGGKVHDANAAVTAQVIAGLNAAGLQRMHCLANHVDVVILHAAADPACPSMP